METVSIKFETAEMPDFKPTIGLEYVKFGANNKFPTYIADLYKGSAKHQSIINGKCMYIFGKGFISTNESIVGLAFLKQYTPLIKACIFDIENQGGCYINVIPNKAGTSYSFHHIPYERIRTNEDNSMFYYSKEWDKYSPKKLPIPKFIKGLKRSSILFIKPTNGNQDTPYALPGWIACINWILADIEVSRHTLTNAKKGFSAKRFINFYNGQPTQEQKRDLTIQFRGEHEGSAGETSIIAFNDADAKPPTIDDLGQSDLSKEDFQHVNDLISENIYAGHGITTPQLFGVPKKEGLGGDGQQLRIGYTLFNNTYVTAKQQEIETLVNFLASLNGINDDFKIIQLDPIGIQFSEQAILQVAPKSWILEQLAIDTNKYPDAPVGAAPATSVNITQPNVEVQKTAEVNTVLTNLTGRQRQNVMSIVRQFGSGKLNKLQASVLLKNGYGFTDKDVNDFLGIDDDPATDDTTKQAFSDTDEDVILVFQQFGESKSEYKALISKPAIYTEEQMFAEAEDIEEDGTKIAVPKVAKRTLPRFEVRYSYEKRAGVKGDEVLPTSRPFCRKMIELDRFYTRQDIQKISAVLGYDVFKRAGGFWNNNGKVEYHCRHEFQSHVVIKKR